MFKGVMLLSNKTYLSIKKFNSSFLTIANFQYEIIEFHIAKLIRLCKKAPKSLPFLNQRSRTHRSVLLLFTKLDFVQVGIRTVILQKFEMGPCFNYRSLVHHNDLIRIHNSGKSMGHDKACSPLS